jgi:hypothetical protein
MDFWQPPDLESSAVLVPFIDGHLSGGDGYGNGNLDYGWCFIIGGQSYRVFVHNIHRDTQPCFPA